MKKIDNDAPIGKLKRVTDFLPPPDQLIMPVKTVKVTISLSKASVDFFKQKARLHNLKYQRLIRELVDRYTAQYSR